jgi:ribonuclease P protein component
VVPKRHAKRAVTRSLLKRQVRGAFERCAHLLPAGIWLVRLRAPFVSGVKGGVHSAVKGGAKGKEAGVLFVSAASAALVQAARSELDSLLGGVGV